LGESAVKVGSAPASFAAFFGGVGSASTREPARRAGDIPSNDNSLRRFTFMLNRPPEIVAPIPKCGRKGSYRVRARSKNQSPSAALGKTTDGCLGVEASSKARKPDQAGMLGEESALAGFRLQDSRLKWSPNRGVHRLDPHDRKDITNLLSRRHPDRVGFIRRHRRQPSSQKHQETSNLCVRRTVARYLPAATRVRSCTRARFTLPEKIQTRLLDESGQVFAMENRRLICRIIDTRA